MSLKIFYYKKFYEFFFILLPHVAPFPTTEVSIYRDIYAHLVFLFYKKYKDV